MIELCPENETGKIWFRETQAQITTCVHTPVGCMDVTTIWEKVHGGSAGRLRRVSDWSSGQSKRQLFVGQPSGMGRKLHQIQSLKLCGRPTEVKRDDQRLGLPSSQIAMKYIVSKVQDPELRKETAKERESRSVISVNQFFASVLHPCFSWLLLQVLLYCPSQFQMPLTWELRKMFILPGFSSCLCSEQFPRCEALLWKNATSEGVFRPVVGAMCSLYVGTTSEMIIKPWSLAPSWKWHRVDTSASTTTSLFLSCQNNNNFTGNMSPDSFFLG